MRFNDVYYGEKNTCVICKKSTKISFDINNAIGKPIQS